MIAFGGVWIIGVFVVLVCLRPTRAASARTEGPQQSCESDLALVQRAQQLAHLQVAAEDTDVGNDFNFKLVDGQDRACRAASPSDNNPAYYSLFQGVKTIDECQSKCTGITQQTPSCPVTAEGRTFGNVQTSRVDECSGLAASRTNDGLYWANNDSGDRQRLYGFDKFGAHRATLWLEGAHAQDWEDIAIGPGPVSDQSYLYVADIGDNHRQRSSIQIYRALEPVVPSDQYRHNDIEIQAQRFEIRYPDGRHDCEALFIDQGPAAVAKGTAGRVYIITKSNGNGHLYWVDLPAAPASLTFTKSGGGALSIPGLVTGADINPSGSLIVVRTYGELFMWPRPQWQSVDQSLLADRCAVNRKGEQQGEAVAFSNDGDHYITVSEGKYPAIWYFSIQGSFQASVMSLSDHPRGGCHGIEYASSRQRCEVWNRGVDIQASTKVSGFLCFQYGVITKTTTANAAPICGGIVLRDVDLTCPSTDGSGCKVLATNMHGKTCHEYCSRNGLECVDGWEEEDENCIVKATLGCHKSYGTTSDLLCQCKLVTTANK